MKKKKLKSKDAVKPVHNNKPPRHLVDKIEKLTKELNQHLNRAENKIEKIIKNLELKTGMTITSIELNENLYLMNIHEAYIHVTLKHDLVNSYVK